MNANGYEYTTGGLNMLGILGQHNRMVDVCSVCTDNRDTPSPFPALMMAAKESIARYTGCTVVTADYSQRRRYDTSHCEGPRP
jgi:hypothetical protein